MVYLDPSEKYGFRLQVSAHAVDHKYLAVSLYVYIVEELVTSLSSIHCTSDLVKLPISELLLVE